MRTLCRVRGTAALACACTLTAAIAAWADTSPRTVNFTVRDANGSPVPNARLVLRGDLGPTELTTTDSTGAAKLALNGDKIVAVVSADGVGEASIEMRLPADATTLAISLQKGDATVSTDSSANTTLNTAYRTKLEYMESLKRNHVTVSGDMGGIAGPGSDSCSTPTAIAGVGVFGFDNSLATVDGLGHPACLFFGEDNMDGDVWFCWTSDCDGIVTVQTCDPVSALDTKIAVYNTCAVCPPTDAELLACNDDSCGLESSLTFPATNGTQYMIRVGLYPGSLGGAGNITISCSGGGGPANDACADALPLNGVGTFGFDGTNATTDGPTHTACTFFGLNQVDNDIWYCWTSDCDGLVTVQTCGLTAVDTKIAIYDGCACPVDDLRLLACNDDACASLQTSVQFTAVSGNTYLIRLGTFPGEPNGIGSMNISCTIVSTICTKSGNQCHTGDLSNASTSDNLIFNTADNFTPAVSENVTSLCWWGTYATGLAPAVDAFTVTYYDDLNGVPGAVIASFAQGAGLVVGGPVATGFQIAGAVPEFEYTGTHAAVPVVAGDCYWVEIKNDNLTIGDRWFWEFGAGGDLISAQDGNPPNGYTFGELVAPDKKFCITLAGGLAVENCGSPPVPANDLCADAIALAIPSVTNGSNVGATPDAEAGLCVTSVDGGPGVWYTVDGTGNTITATTCGNTDYDSKLHVYCGPCNSLLCVTGNDDDFNCVNGLNSTVTWCSQLGVEYHIYVSGFAGGAGNFELFLSDDGVPCVGAVECAPTGACCLPDDSCILATAAACALANGDYAGDGVPCQTFSGGVTYTTGPIAVAIPDGPGGSTGPIPLIVPDGNPIETNEIQVGILISHTFQGDVEVDIASPLGTVVRIVNRPGVPALGTFGFGTDNYGNPLTGEKMIFADNAVQGPYQSPPLAAGVNNPVGKWLPDTGPLNAWVGENKLGTWTLTANDQAGIDTGTVLEWCIIKKGAANDTCPLCAGDRGDVNCSGGAPDFFDIDPFLLALFDLATYQATFCGGSICAADIDCSGAVDFFDIDPFLACLFAACPPCP